MKKRVYGALALILVLCLALTPMTALAKTSEDLYFVWINGQNEENTEHYAQSLSGPIGGRTSVVFYLSDGNGGYTPAPVQSITTANAAVAEGSVTGSSASGNPICTVYFRGVGDTTLTLQTAKGAYTLDVSVTLPELGWYSGTTASVDTLLADHSFICKGDSSTVYMVSAFESVAITGFRMINVQGSAPETINHFVKDGGKYLELQLQGQVGEGGASIEYEVTYTNPGGARSMRNVIRLIDGNDRLVMRYVNPGPNGFTEAAADQSAFDTKYTGMGNRPAVFYLRSAEEYKAVSGVTSGNSKILTVTQIGTSDKNSTVYALAAAGVGQTTLNYTYGEGDASKTVSIPVSVAAPGELVMGSTTVGFGGFQDAEKTVVMLNVGDKGRGFGTNIIPDDTASGYAAPEPWVVRILAGKNFDKGLYEHDKSVGLKVERMWIEVLEGDDDLFSWSRNSCVTTVTDVNNEEGTRLYHKAGHLGAARIYAQVAVTMGGMTNLQLVSARATVSPFEKNTVTLTDWNRLSSIAIAGGKVNEIVLPAGTYEGTLKLPADLQGMIYLMGSKQGTTIAGGLDLNGSTLTEISGIRFAAPDNASEAAKAIYNGGCNYLENCVFYNYDVAIESKAAGLINPTSCNLFINNEVAVSVDASQVNRLTYAPWAYNTFINNGTAIQIGSLPTSVFGFRITNSNFINNGCDYDAACGGTLYFYRNYYCQYAPDGNDRRPEPGRHHADRRNGRDGLRLEHIFASTMSDDLGPDLEHSRAKTRVSNGTKIITNYRRHWSVRLGWAGSSISDAVFGHGHGHLIIDAKEQTVSGRLTSDWEDETRIVNDEADGLLLSGEALETAAEDKSIAVVDVDSDTEREEVLGTWHFE